MKGLKYQSHGLIVEINQFVSSSFYIGVQGNFTLNLFDDESKQLYQLMQQKESPSFFSGVDLLAQGGYELKLTNTFSTRLQVAGGLQILAISDKSSVTNSESESQLKGVYELGLGMITHF
ncbi:MAG: hypothetical protein ACI85I_001964 [Arenicella sp.]